MLGKLRDILGNLPSAGNWPIMDTQLNSKISSRQQPQMHAPDYRIILWQAAASGDCKALSDCLDKQLLEVNATDFTGCTALIHAVSNGQINATALLLQCPAVDVNIEDNSGKSALCYAIENRNNLLASWLLSRDNEEHIKNKALTRAVAQFCQSQLNPDESMRVQAYQVYEELIGRLLQHGANPSLGGLREAVQNHPRLLTMLNAASKAHAKQSLPDMPEIKVEKLHVTA